MLYILGNGENHSVLNKYISENKLENHIKLLGYKNNIFPFLKASKGFISSSLWEDPGFVLIEAGLCRTPVFASDAKPGPFELIKDNVNGTNFKNNNMEDFVNKFDKYLVNSQDKKMLLENLRFCKNFTIFNHYRTLSNYLK